MKKILLIGPGGAGKSTLAKAIANCLSIPLVHLDALFWQPGWVQTPAEEWEEKVRALVEGEAWVMDGNFGGTLDLRLAACDTVLFLDLSPWVCVWRVFQRRLRFHGGSRPDMAPGCPEKLDWDFIWWILSYRWKRSPGICRKLAQAEVQGKRVYHFKSKKEVKRFVDNLLAGQLRGLEE